MPIVSASAVRSCPYCRQTLSPDAARCESCEQDVSREGADAALARRVRLFSGCTGCGILSLWVTGLFVQCLGLLGLGTRSGAWVLFGGGAMMALAMTVLARSRNRAWGWGFLGFFNWPGALLVFFLKGRCRSCGSAVDRGYRVCPGCRMLL